MTSKPPAQRLDALTSLRFVAAAGIVLLHCRGFFGLPADMAFGERVPLWLGVSFFFVLSGFILTHVYPRLDSPAVCGRFLLARFARIWPCHVLALVLFCLANGDTFGSIRQRGAAGPHLAVVAMVHSWIPMESFFLAGNPPSWTIATEFGFYLLFPLLIWRLDVTWHFKLAGCLLLSAGMIAACHLGRVTAETANGLLYINPLARLLEFSVGMATAHLFRVFGPRIRLDRVGGTLAELAAVALVAVTLYVSPDLVNGVITRSGLSPDVRIWFFHALSCPSFAVLIFVAGLGRGWMTRALAWPAFIFLGEISYSVYLLHIPLLRYFHTREWAEIGATNWPSFACYWLLLLALSHISWVLVETPVRKFLIGLWPRPAYGTRDDRPATTARRGRRASLPTRLIVAAELLLVASFVYLTEQRRPYQVLANERAIALREKGRPEVHDIQFGNRYLLRNVFVRPTKQGLRVGLMWQSRRKQRLDCYVALHLCDPEGNVLEDFSYNQDPRRHTVSEGMIWLEKRVIPYRHISGGAGRGEMSLAIGIGRISQDLIPLSHSDHVPRDEGNRRVLLKLDLLEDYDLGRQGLPEGTAHSG